MTPFALQSWQSSDGSVTAVIDGKPGRYMVIYEWNSAATGKGNTNNALQELKQQFQTNEVHVMGIGYPDDRKQGDAWDYWTHQHSKGRVSNLYDDDGEVILTGAV